MNTTIKLIAVVATLLTLSSFSPWTHWLFRVGDFPRLQLIKLLLATILCSQLISEPVTNVDRLFSLSLFGCLAFQIWWILPFTPFVKKESTDAVGVSNSTVRVLAFNLLRENRRSAEVKELIRETDADIVLLAEPDAWWAEQLRELSDFYKHSVVVPLENCFGMILYSRFELINTEIKFLVQSDVPSVHTNVRLPDGRIFAFHGLHPRPPSPTDEGDSRTRDAELFLVAKAVAAENLPAIVAGDLNDVSWSPTTKLFRKIGGLLDPRIGRGFFNSFHTRNLLCRFPLDHVLHTAHFGLVEISRAPRACGSDHFPMIVDLHLETTEQVPTPESRMVDLRRVDAVIRRGLMTNPALGPAPDLAGLTSGIMRSVLPPPAFSSRKSSR